MADSADIFAKCRDWTAAREARAARTYPYYRPLTESGGGAEGVVDGRRVVIAASNDYLALASDPRVVEAGGAALRRFGTSCSGSRLLNGTLALHERLEGELAAFLRQPAALVTTTGFQANLALACLLGRGDLLLLDQHSHASLLDAARLGQARHLRFRHNDRADLARLLGASGTGTGSAAGTGAWVRGGRMAVTEGLFSMGGDLADLPGLAATLAEAAPARLVVDGAHDIGLLGEHGRGAAELLGAEGSVDLITGTFSKCFGSVGGFLAGPEEVIDYLRHRGRSVLFSAAAPPAAVGAALAALGIVRAEPERRRRVLALSACLHRLLRELGWDTGSSLMPVVPVHVGDDAACLRLWQGLFDAGVFANAILPPAVPPGRAMIRLSVTAAHTERHLAVIADAFATQARTAVPRARASLPALPR
ncbi:aminotransferase class I/II-fold pyridoxal phosphate-dependent enzyme [Streptomyces sp. DSM 44917]|uniref:8-amino-7-oxononanoate synthase n=1 Tax=Streptomyces boetiae TaxID=3075541 RepID=A0ABU2L391_9ACTN|nr:aminotransferase class I/II-fold pyridoxal phosphate-dependent enzyme [Streptomyces sp. DSM 44917]MDT0306029.1 aminotransferase class I/II-fold pyridoxal phosphate-dependent enzyme [Streptomyces sp. DSM 44917]